MGEELSVEVHSVLDDYIIVSINDGPLLKISYTPVEVAPNALIKFFRRRTRSSWARVGFSLPGKRIAQHNPGRKPLPPT